MATTISGSSNSSFGGTIDSTGIDDNATTTAITIGSDEHVSLAHGIGFNGDTAAANALDDYEEGTWTISLAGSTSDATISSGNAHSCTYTKIGRTVHVTTPEIAISSLGVGSASIGGIPYPPSNQIGVLIAGSIYGTSDSNTYYIMNNALLKRSGGSYNWVAHSNLTTGWFRLSMTYQTG